MRDFNLIQVQSSRELKEFIEFPYELYRGDPYWVPPLRIAQRDLFDTRKHPFHAHGRVQCFLARRGRRTIGRIAAILDPNHNKFHSEDAGFFGFFECVNEQEPADALFGAVRDWLRERGMRLVRGPVSPSTNYECGLLVDGFDSSPHVMMPYNPPYYEGLIETAGLRKAKDLWAYYLEASKAALERVERLAARSAEMKRVKIRPIRRDRFDEDVELAWDVYNSAWSRNWGFVPMTKDEFIFMSRDLKTVLVPELVLFGEVDGKVVGFNLALPDINQALKPAKGRLFPLGILKILYHKRFIRSMRVMALGVTEEYRAAGVAAGFYAELIRYCRQHGYLGGEMSWVLEDNTLMQRSIEALGGKRYKTYRIYEWI